MLPACAGPAAPPARPHGRTHPTIEELCMSSNHKWLRLVALLGLLAILASACGGGDDAGDETEEAAEPTEEEAAEPTEEETTEDEATEDEATEEATEEEATEEESAASGD